MALYINQSSSMATYIDSKKKLKLGMNIWYQFFAEIFQNELLKQRTT